LQCRKSSLKKQCLSLKDYAKKEFKEKRRKPLFFLHIYRYT
jgi:hypothetical protein